MIILGGVNRIMSLGDDFNVKYCRTHKRVSNAKEGPMGVVYVDRYGNEHGPVTEEKWEGLSGDSINYRFVRDQRIMVDADLPWVTSRTIFGVPFNPLSKVVQAYRQLERAAQLKLPIGEFDPQREKLFIKFDGRFNSEGTGLLIYGQNTFFSSTTSDLDEYSRPELFSIHTLEGGKVSKLGVAVITAPAHFPGLHRSEGTWSQARSDLFNRSSYLRDGTPNFPTREFLDQIAQKSNN